ncbi:MAG TPA: hypothetical protein VE078_09685, partial [Thermoanaerobaculia bacterium]|nr:hypothetical protein [Thermoanaerobaculia bacterium]
FLRTGDFTRNQLVAKAGWRFGTRHFVEVSRLSDGFSGEANMLNLFGTQDQDAATVHAFYGGSAGPLSLRTHAYRTKQDLNENFTYRDSEGLFGEGRKTGARGEVDFRIGQLMGWGSGAWEETEVTSVHPAFLRADGSNILEPPGEEDPGAAVVANPRRRIEWGGGIGYELADDLLAAHGSLRRLDHGDAAESGTAWQLEAVGRPVEGLTVRGAVGRALRAASPMAQAILASRAADGLEIHPGRAAAPEELEAWTGWRGEVAWSRPGWRIAAGASGAKGNGAFLWLSQTAWLYFDPADLETVRLGGAGFNTFDVVDLSAQGLEAEVVVPLPWDFEGRLRARWVELIEEESGAQVPYVPRTQVLAQLRYASRFFPSRDLLLEGRLTGRYSGERSTMEGESLADYLVGDVLVQATIINFTMFLSFKNIAGQNVRSEEAFLLPAREGFFGVNWRFRN